MTEKSRKTALVIIAVILSLITLWIAAGFCSVVTRPFIDPDNINGVNFDGADFSFFFKMQAMVINNFITMIAIMAMSVAELVLFPVTWAVFGSIAFRNSYGITGDEIVFSRRVLLISMFATFAAALVFMIIFTVISGSGLPFLALLFCWLNPLFMRVLYIRKLKIKAYAG